MAEKKTSEEVKEEVVEEVKEKAVEPKEEAVEPKKSGVIEEIIEKVGKLTVLELSDLVQSLKDKFSITMVAVPAGAPSPAGAPGAEAEEQTEFSPVLTVVGEKKIQVIKEVRAVTSLGLKEAKELVDGAPRPIKEAISKKEAEEIKTKVEAAGATVEIK